MTANALFPNRPTGELVMRAQLALGLTHRRFGEALGSSERTSLRWAAGRSTLSVPQLCTLAKLVYPHDAAIADALARAASETLESLGIVAPPAPLPPPPPERTPLAPHLVADLVTCAAADVLGVAPRTARAALLAGFTRARELGLGVADVESALAASDPPAAGG